MLAKNYWCDILSIPLSSSNYLDEKYLVPQAKDKEELTIFFSINMNYISKLEYFEKGGIMSY